MRTICIILLLTIFSPAFGQNATSYFYKGKMDDKMPITLFIKSEENGCTSDLVYRGMYKYDGVSNWLQLDIDQNKSGQFIFVEYNFSGVMILKKTPDGFSGLWISPDTKRQLKVEFHKETLNEKDKINLEDKFEQVNYENNDC